VSAKAFMFQGTGSSVGKSLMVAGLCRAFADRGLKVRPFKPQNMSNNAAVTDDGPDGGGEIGRAQALQALGARVPLSVHMNPILLKPQTDTGAQIVVQGKVWGQAKARDFQAIKPQLLPAVLESFETLKREADLVLVEGAGSASEINLRANDIANMGFARAADVPVCVIGDIDRGGVIASLVGTHTVLPEEDRALITGFMVNRMRGDLSLFDDGMTEIAKRTSWRNLGLVPHFEEANLLPSEDAMELAERASGDGEASIHIAVPALPRIANFDDLDPLRAEPSVKLSNRTRAARTVAGLRSHHPARLKGDHLPTLRLCERKAGTSI
jgi:adenosylcobyric acid synthase